MNAEGSLFDAYREWRRLATACQKAICQRNWGFLLECQDAIRNLQPFITTATRQVRDEWKHSHAGTARESELRAIIMEVKALVESNKRLLQAARAAALNKREQLEQSGRNLRRIQRSYGSAQTRVLRGVA